MGVSLGKTAFVDLSSGKVEVRATPEGLARRYLGGRGMNMAYLYKLLPPGVDPLGPENVLVFGNGLLTGSAAPSASRINISALSPESRALGDSNLGGFFPAAMALAGFDRLVITGKSAKPVYLYLNLNTVEVRDAASYWGLNCGEVQRKFKQDLGEEVEAACIGRAGEKLVRFACIMNGPKNAAGRGGMGAVMGSKNLKAVVARGNGTLAVADPEGLLGMRQELGDYLAKSKVIQVLGKVGTPLLYENSNKLGALRVHNSQLNSFSTTLNAAEVEKRVFKMLSCYGCPVHCRHRNDLGGEGPEYSTIGLLGANCGLADLEQVLELNNLVNDLGLDASSTGTIIPWALELAERGLLPRKFDEGENPTQTDLVQENQCEKDPLRKLAFGDYYAIRQLMIDISERRGLGDLLAESSRAVEQLPPEAGDYLMQIKGLPQSDPHDPRYIKSFALGLAVASRGADHLRNRPTLDILGLPKELTAKLYGTEVNADPTAYESKEHVVYFSENIFAVVDCLGVCKFVCHGFNSPHLLKYEQFAKLIEAVTGWQLSVGELEAVGKRVVDLERMLNQSLGLSKADDTLPRRYFDEPMPDGLTKGHRILRDEFAVLLDRYYSLRNWDWDGQVNPERRAELEREVVL